MTEFEKMQNAARKFTAETAAALPKIAAARRSVDAVCRDVAAAVEADARQFAERALKLMTERRRPPAYRPATKEKK